MINKLQEENTMHMINKMMLRLGVVFALLIILTLPVYAYIDPGTGSMIIQAIAATVLALGAMFGIFRQKIKIFFLNIGKRRKKGAAENDQSAISNKIGKTDGEHDSHEG
jgi:uncharacterized membrane protein YqjE